MPDKRTDVLLRAINDFCEGGSFRVVDEGELLGCFSVKDGVDAQSVKQMLDYLRDGKYVDVQYAEEGVYCVRPLPEGRRYFERAREKKREGRRKLRLFVLAAAAASFLGALVGSALTLLIASLFP